MSVDALEGRLLLAATVSEYPLRTMGGPSEYATLGPDHNIWVTLSTDNIGQLNTSTGVVNQYPIPAPNSAPGAIITGPDKNLWFIEAATNQFGVVNPATGAITEVPVLADGASQIQDLAAGPDGNIWFTEYKSDKIGEFNPTMHAVQEFTIPTAAAEPYDIVAGPDGNLWFTESGSNKIGMINPTTHAIADFAIPSTGNDQAEGIAVGSDGSLWFTETAANAIGTINPTTHAFKTYTTGLSANAGVAEIAPGPDGNLWFVEDGISDIGKINPATGAITQYADGGINNPNPTQGITSGADGNLYFGSGGIGKITTAGKLTGIGVPVSYTGNSVFGSGSATSIIQGKDGNLWFLDDPQIGGGLGAAQVGLVGPTGQFSQEYVLQPNYELYAPVRIASDPTDGSLWFTQYSIFQAQNKPDLIDRIDAVTRVISQFNVPTTGAGVVGITFNSSDGSFWFTEESANRLGIVNPTTDAIADNFVTLPAGSNPFEIVADPAGKLWFTEYGTGMVGVYDLSSGNVTQVSLGSSSSGPEGIALGPDGNIWFAEQGAAKIGVINPTTEMVITQVSAPVTGEIAAGPAGAPRFTESGGLGRITTSTYAITSVSTPNASPTALTSGADGNLWFAAQGGSGFPNYTGTVNLASISTPTQLAITTQPPAGVTATRGFGLVVTVENASNTPDTYYNGPVAIALGANPGGSILSGTLTATAVNGRATFPGLSLNQAGTGYTIVASAPGLPSATTGPINVSLAATHLVVISQPPAPPGGVAATAPFSITVAAEDASGNVDTSYNSTLQLAIGNNPGGSTLTGTTLLGASGGMITFTGLSLNNPGLNYTLLVSDPSSRLTAGATGGFNVTPKPATHLVFTAEPQAGAVAGAASISLTVSAENAQGQVDTGDNSPVTIALVNANGATLGGVLSTNLVAGVATFSGLSINLIGTTYMISATSGTLTPGTSTAISVVSASASTFSLIPLVSGGVIAGVPFSLKVTALDPFGNVSNSYSGTIHISSPTDSKFTPPGDYTFLTADQGSHVFQVTLPTLGVQTLKVVDDSNSSITASAPVTVSPPTATKTTLIVAPLGTVLGQAVTLSATVSPNAGTGTVSFYDGTTFLGSSPLTASGAILAAISNLTFGSHSLTAKYGGSLDGSRAPSQSAPTNFQVGPDATVALASASTTSANVGQSVILTATITVAAPGSGIPTGMVTFLDGSKSLGSVMLDPTGHATLPITTLGLGTHSITVSYAGVAADGPSQSPAISVYVGDTVKADFDGDGKADLVVFGLIPGTNLYGFTIKTSSSGFTQTTVFDNAPYGFGNAYSIPVVGDYFGDGKAAYAIWYPENNGLMHFLAVSSVNPSKIINLTFGLATDLPIVGDVDGDGKADFGTFGNFPGLGYRYDFLLSSRNFDINQRFIFTNYGYGFGIPGSTPVLGDFTGVGHDGLGSYFPGSGPGALGTLYFLNFTIPQGTGFVINPPPIATLVKTFGYSTDTPIAVDINGDGKSDLAFYGLDPRTGKYRYDVLTSTSNFTQDVYFDNGGLGYGYAGSYPTIADYEGTGKADISLFQPDGHGGAFYAFQDAALGYGVLYDFATPTEVPVDAPAYVLARRIRGQ